MSPPAPVTPAVGESGPRASGDEPRALELKLKLMEWSPRERG